MHFVGPNPDEIGYLKKLVILMTVALVRRFTLSVVTLMNQISDKWENKPSIPLIRIFQSSFHCSCYQSLVRILALDSGI